MYPEPGLLVGSEFAAIVRSAFQVNSAAAKNVVYVGTSLDAASIGGREQLSQLIRVSLHSIGVGETRIVDLPRTKVPATRAPLAILRGHVDGVSSASIARVIAMIDDGPANTVFLDGSNLGSIAMAVKHARPEVEIVTFFHNCEARFFLGAYRQRKTLRNVGILAANFLAERRAVRFSDKRICLNRRDSDLLLRLYGVGATHISPMAIQDQLPPGAFDAPPTRGERYALFVGGTFYANRQGIEWFVQHVAEKASIKTYVVGKGFELWKDLLERNGNVKVIGTVGSIAPWYIAAQFVIAPIFDGSGMKTKVAEALMFGKRVVGTPESFTGYEEHVDLVGVVCRSAEDFISALDGESRVNEGAPSPALRRIYEEHYSPEAARNRLARILGDVSVPRSGAGHGR